MDGANSLQTLVYIVVPMLAPALISVCLFQFMWTMNDFLGTADLPVLGRQISGEPGAQALHRHHRSLRMEPHPGDVGADDRACSWSCFSQRNGTSLKGSPLAGSRAETWLSVQLENLEKVYGGSFKAVHGINLEIEDGEFMVFVGPSGCAKSTTLRMVAGLEEISGGEILIGDQRVNDLPPGKRSIAMVFQNYALYPHMKVRGNLAFGLKIAGIAKPEIEKAIEQCRARFLKSSPLLDRLPKQLSGGQAQRVALGRALIKKPGVFLFDEPLSNLDAEAARFHACPHHRSASPAEGGGPVFDRRLRDARSDRGHDDGRPYLRHAGRAHHAGRHAEGNSTIGPAEPVRRRFHWQSRK